MKLETQLAKLAELGLVLNPGIEIEDLLYSCDREELEANPLKLSLLFLLSVEVERAPWGRRMCNQIWNFDTECIISTGDYVKIVKNLCLLTGAPDYLQDITDSVDEGGDCWLEYTRGEQRRHWSLEFNDDWADMLTLTYVMDDLQRDGQQFYAIDNGQAMILLYLDPETAIKLGDLCAEDLEPVIPA